MALEPRFNFDFNTTVIDGAADTKAQRQMQNIASKESQRYTVGDFINIVGKGAELHNSIQAAEKVTQANESKIKYLNSTMEESYRKGTAESKQETLQGLLTEAMAKGGSYLTAMQGMLQAPMAKVAVKVKSNLTDAGVNTSPAAYESYMNETVWVSDGTKDGLSGKEMTNRDAGKTIDDFVTSHVKDFPFLNDSKPAVAMAVAAAIHVENIAAISEAETPEELANVIADIKDSKIQLDTNFLYRNKNKEMVSVLKASKVQETSALQAKDKEFRLQSFQRQAAMIVDYRVSPHIYAKEVHITAKTPVAEVKANKEYTKKHEERMEADLFISKYIPGERTTYLPDNSILKKEWTEEVTSSLMSSFNTNNIEEFIKVGNTEVDFVGQTGEAFMQLFNVAETNEEAGILIAKFNSIDAYPGGASVLNNMIGADEYVRIKEIGYALISRPDLDVQGAKDWIDGNKSKINTIGLSPELKNHMFLKAAKLGPQADAYISLIKNLMKGNPYMTATMLSDEAKILANRNIEDSNGMKVDISKGVPPSQDPNAMNPDAIDTLVKDRVPEGTTNLKYINGLVVSYNVDGAITGVSNIEGIVDESNEIETEQALEDRAWDKKMLSGSQGEALRLITEARIAVKDGIRYIIDNIAETVLTTPTRTAVGIIELIYADLGMDLEAADIDVATAGLLKEYTIAPEQKERLLAASKNIVEREETKGALERAETNKKTVEKLHQQMIILGEINTSYNTVAVLQKKYNLVVDGIIGKNSLKVIPQAEADRVMKQQRAEFSIATDILSQRVAKDIGPDIEPSWIAAMWKHETEKGNKVLANTFNLGNIKGKHKGKGKKFKVWELDKDGKKVWQTDMFKQYPSFTEAANDYATFLKGARYKKVRTATTLKEFITELEAADYFTDDLEPYLKSVTAILNEED